MNLQRPVVAIALGVLCTVATPHRALADPSAPRTTTGVASARLTVEGMTCASCSLAIKTALKKLEGVKAVEVNRADKKAVVEYEPSKVQVQQLVDTVNKLGYRASLPTPRGTAQSP